MRFIETTNSDVLCYWVSFLIEKVLDFKKIAAKPIISSPVINNYLFLNEI